MLNEFSRGEHVVFKNENADLWAVGWQDNVYKSYLTTHGTTLPGKLADKRRQDKESNVNFALQVPRPACIAKYNEEMGAVDRHNFYRQDMKERERKNLTLLCIAFKLDLVRKEF